MPQGHMTATLPGVRFLTLIPPLSSHGSWPCRGPHPSFHPCTFPISYEGLGLASLQFTTTLADLSSHLPPFIYNF